MTITTHQSSPTRHHTHQIQLINLYYFFQIVKEQNSQLTQTVKPKPERLSSAPQA
jgi:hypothetical protein